MLRIWESLQAQDEIDIQKQAELSRIEEECRVQMTQCSRLQSANKQARQLEEQATEQARQTREQATEQAWQAKLQAWQAVAVIIRADL